MRAPVGFQQVRDTVFMKVSLTPQKNRLTLKRHLVEKEF